jgi:hypothetical protein
MKKRNLLFLAIFAIFSITILSCEDLFGEEENSAADSKGCSGYNGPTNIEKQYEYQCKAAYAYKCNGDTEALRKQCAYYKQLQQQLNLPDCNYCD